MSKLILGKLNEYLFLSSIGGTMYVYIELLWRSRSHWSMFILGALCFVLVGLINEVLSWDTPIEVQSVIGAGIITVFEFFTGCLLNLGLGWNIWDYSDLPYNIHGQICLYFSLLWIIVSLIAIIVDDIFRYEMFGEEKPRYKSIIFNVFKKIKNKIQRRK